MTFLMDFYPNGFRFVRQEGMDLPSQRDSLSLPSLATNDRPNAVFEQNFIHQNCNAARELHSTSNEGSESFPCSDDRTVNSFEHFNRRASIPMPASWDTGDLAPDIPLKTEYIMRVLRLPLVTGLGGDPFHLLSLPQPLCESAKVSSFGSPV